MAEPIMPGGKLSKSFYMELEEGLFLVSDVGGFSPLDPRCFADYVVPAEQRLSQWAQIKEAQADQRGCSVFASEDDFREWQKGWKQGNDGRSWRREDDIA